MNRPRKSRRLRGALRYLVFTWYAGVVSGPQQKPIGSKPIPGRKAHGRSRISNGQDLLIDGRRDIANAVLADQSGADYGEAAQGHQLTWLLPRAGRERMGTLLR